ncbi:MAG TPA: citrate synthase/methylcitrate synthase [Gemmatimonadaceae bacterium]|nr:citrate synthase/methylcitrate synthase [Gemmatimonadaceae bacterium]
MAPNTVIAPGLEGVVAATTRLSHVDGEAGELTIAGFPVGELAANATFEETTWLLWHGELPGDAELDAFRTDLAAHRELPPATLALLRACARARVDSMDALRLALGTVSLVSTDAVAIVALAPTIVAAYARLLEGKAPISPRGDLRHAANYLYMLSGSAPDAERVRALETYLNTVIDHGLNASTFTCRVIVSTGSDLVSAVVGAVGALKGPLHGGAPGPALETVFEIGEASRAESVLRAKIEAGERLMGFGHRVYKVRDPRADVLAAAAERLFTHGGDLRLYTLARHVERTALALLEEYKPDRRLKTNVEFYTALLLHGLGLDVPLFTPTFAISRVSGWIAHAFEQRAANRLIRPKSEYVGPRGRRWHTRVPMAGERAGALR